MRTKNKDSVTKAEVKGYWDQIGWHRPLAGFWYNYILILVFAIPGLLIIGVVIPAILPYPEALGFARVATSYLAPIYLIADFGIKEAIKRYIAQYSEVNPRKALKYMSFFFYFQMFSGLLLVTGTSILAITVIPKTDISYAPWFFLGYVLIEWPGTAGLFTTALGGFQQFDKENIIVVIQNVAIQGLTQIGFILLGRYWGRMNPAVGELMGATAGFIVGSYVDDLIAMIIGMVLFKKVLAPFGISLKEAFYTSFDKEIVKEVLTYGGKVFPSGLSYVGVSALISVFLVNWLNNYATWMGLYSIAATLVDALALSFSYEAPLSESYNNGKKHLATYFIQQQFRWWGILSIGFFMAPILFLIPYIVVIAAPEYTGVQWMVYPLFLGAFILFPSMFSGGICQACNLPAHATYMNFIEQGTRLLTYLIILAPWGVRNWFGDQAVIIAWLFAESPGYLAKGIYGWWIVNKRLFPGKPIKAPMYQTFVAPFISMIPMFPISILLQKLFQVVYYANEFWGYGLAVVYILILLYIFPIIYLMPVYGLLGAWDEQSLIDFKKAAYMSGPSKFLVKILYKTAKWGHDHSPFRSKFEINPDLALREGEELIQIRKKIEKAV